MTGRDWISAALRKIGVLASGDTLDPQEATDGLAEGNRLLSSWSTEGLLIHAITAESPLTLTAGDATVTLGASGDITTRPSEIERAVIRVGTTDYPPMRKLTLDEYSAIPTKTVQGIPYAFYDDGGYPQRTLSLYTVPAGAYSLLLWTKRPLTSIASLDTSVSLPDGYEDALVYNLAVRLGPEYGRVVPDLVIATANQLRANLKRANHRTSLLDIREIPGDRARGRFDILSGEYRR